MDLNGYSWPVPRRGMQLAVQLAWYKTHGSFAATVETALMRAYDKARTMTIRTLSEDSCTWVLSMTMRAPPGLPFLLSPLVPIIIKIAMRLRLLRRTIQASA